MIYTAETEYMFSRPRELVDYNIMNSHVGELTRCRVFVYIKQNQDKCVKVNERQLLAKYKELSNKLNHLKLE